jgi:glycosyltransferase involved in cell wall biosynthesis
MHRHGLDLAVAAIDLVRRERPDVYLTVVGRGDAMPDLFDLRRRLGLEDRVELRDELVLAEDLPAIIADADAGVVPYRDDVFTDALVPTKLMEYAVTGLPCIAARTTAIAAYFQDTMVEFFQPGDVQDLARCIRLLRDRPDRLVELSARSSNFTNRYNWAQAGDAYVALVQGQGQGQVR